MEVKDGSNITASGDPDPQMPAVGSEQAGSRGSSSNDCRDTGVASQAPVILPDTSAELFSTDDLEYTSQTACGPNAVNTMVNLSSSVRSLKACLVTQDEDQGQLIQKASALEIVVDKSRSPLIKEAIKKLLAVVEDIRERRGPVVRAFNAVLINTSAILNDARRHPVANRPPAGTSGVKLTSVSTQTRHGSEFFIRPKKFNARTQTDITNTHDAVPKSTSTEERATDMPCWWEASPMRTQPERRNPNKKSAARTEQRETSDHANEPEFEVVRGRRRRGKKGANKVPTDRTAKEDTAAPQTLKAAKEKRRRPPRTQAVVLEKPGDKSYAQIVKEVKETVQQESLNFEISARRAKSGNLVLETLDKNQADSLVVALKRRFGDSSGIRRPTPSTALILIGIEDSVDEVELRKTLETHDPELKTVNEVKIREGSNGVRTAIVRVPITPGLKLARLKKIRIGWSICRVKELAPRPAGCARCSSPNHDAKVCTGVENRRYFRCKAVGHLIASCKIPKRDVHSGESDQNPCVAAQDKAPSTSACP